MIRTLSALTKPKTAIEKAMRYSSLLVYYEWNDLCAFYLWAIHSKCSLLRFTLFT